MEPCLNFYKSGPEVLNAMTGLTLHIARLGLGKSFVKWVRLRSHHINGCSRCIDIKTSDACQAGESKSRRTVGAVWGETPLLVQQIWHLLIRLQAPNTRSPGHQWPLSFEFRSNGPSNSTGDKLKTRPWHLHISEWLTGLGTKAFSMHRVFRTVVALGLASASLSYAQALHMGFVQLKQSDGGMTAVFYPTLKAEVPIQKGPFSFSWAGDALPERGNKRLIVVSHGSGGSPWVHTDLARVLVERGFVVAMPQHHGDNYLDQSEPGPISWTKRPAEVSRAIDAVAKNAALAKVLSFDAVGVFGGSSGGHTVLSLAGGTWSFSRFRDHCEKNIQQDFSSCVGFTTLLEGNGLDVLKIWAAKRIITWRYSEDKNQQYTDSRIKAAVAMVPYAADFDPISLAEPKVALGLVIALKDVNQTPSFHVEAIRKACLPQCEVIMTLIEAGHGAMLSPLPPMLPGSIENYLLGDPKYFNRNIELPRLHGLIADFFTKKLYAFPREL